jgi:hypothetical protein
MASTSTIACLRAVLSRWLRRSIESRAPYWVRLRRIGGVFTAYVSADGQAWRQQGSSVTITMNATVYVGLAVTSHRDGSLATAVFSNVSFGPVGTTPPPTNSPPVITGTPPTGASVGVQYAFTPSATDLDGNPLTYSITNRPSWATFSTSTGRLAGTPTSANIGTFSNIVIGVSDGQATAQLPPFAIVVTNVPKRPRRYPHASDLGHPGDCLLVHAHGERPGWQSIDVLDHECAVVGDVQHDDGPLGGYTDREQRRNVQQHRDQGQ